MIDRPQQRIEDGGTRNVERHQLADLMVRGFDLAQVPPDAPVRASVRLLPKKLIRDRAAPGGSIYLRLPDAPRITWLYNWEVLLRIWPVP
jgi:hypothetical protein